MKKLNIYKLMDLMEDLKKVNGMITLHADDSSDFMLNQYKSKRDKLMSYLIDELVEPGVRSPKSFAIILKLLENHYPNLKREARKKDKNHDLLDKLSLQLV